MLYATITSVVSKIFAFRWDAQPYAIKHEDLIEGWALPLPEGGELFLFRGAQDRVFRSTSAYVSTTGFTNKNGVWFEDGSGVRFDVATRTFGDAPIKKLSGFDTYWYNWSLNNSKTQVIAAEAAAEGGSSTRERIKE